jgi:hypothetical protein
LESDVISPDFHVVWTEPHSARALPLQELCLFLPETHQRENTYQVHHLSRIELEPLFSLRLFLLYFYGLATIVVYSARSAMLEEWQSVTSYFARAKTCIAYCDK